jgi:hypothetical protein
MRRDLRQTAGMPGWGSLDPLPLNSNSSGEIFYPSSMEVGSRTEDVDLVGDEELKMAYDMSEMEKIFRISEYPATGTYLDVLIVYPCKRLCTFWPSPGF